MTEKIELGHHYKVLSELPSLPGTMPLEMLDMALDYVAYENVDIVNAISRDSKQSRSAINIISKYIDLVSFYAQLSANKYKLLVTAPTRDDETNTSEEAKENVSLLDVPEHIQDLAIKKLLPEYYYMYSDEEKRDLDEKEREASSNTLLFLDDLRNNVGDAGTVVNLFALSLNSNRAHEDTFRIAKYICTLQGKTHRLEEEL